MSEHFKNTPIKHVMLRPIPNPFSAHTSNPRYCLLPPKTHKEIEKCKINKMKVKTFNLRAVSQPRLHSIISTLNPHAQTAQPSYWSANKIHHFCLLPFTLPSSSFSRLLLLYSYLLPFPLSCISSAPFSPPHSSQLGLPHCFPARSPQKLKASPSFLAAPWGPSLLGSRSQKPSSASRALQQRVSTATLRDHKIYSSSRGDGDSVILRHDSIHCLHSKDNYLVPACPSQALALETCLLSLLQQKREALIVPGCLKLKGKRDVTLKAQSWDMTQAGGS